MVNKFNKDVRNKTKNPSYSASELGLWVTVYLAAYLGKVQCLTHQAPPSMEFSRPEHWSGWPFPSPGDLPRPGIEPGSPALQAECLLSELAGTPQPPLDALQVRARLGAKVGRLFRVLHCLQVSPRCQSGSLPSTLPSSAGFPTHPRCAF